MDEKRRALQTELDEALSKSNKLSKEIGALMKEGKKEEAEAAKEQTAQYKELTKRLNAELRPDGVPPLLRCVYRIPNESPNDD